MNSEKDTLQDEYPDSLIECGTRGKYAQRYRAGTNVVIVNPSTQNLFTDSDTVSHSASFRKDSEPDQ